MSLTAELRTFAETLEIDWLGCCPVSRLEAAPEDRRPAALLPTAQSAISLGFGLNRTPIEHLPATRSAYMLEHDEANRCLDAASQRIARFLEARGHAAVGFDCGAGFYHQAGKVPERFAGDISHKHVAVACGLGMFGLHNLVISDDWGPRVRLTSILTSAELEPDGYGFELCPTRECERCVEACPVGALDGWKDSYDPEVGRAVDKEACYNYIFTELKGQRCGLCIQACPAGLQ